MVILLFPAYYPNSSSSLYCFEKTSAMAGTCIPFALLDPRLLGNFCQNNLKKIKPHRKFSKFKNGRTHCVGELPRRSKNHSVSLPVEKLKQRYDHYSKNY